MDQIASVDDTGRRSDESRHRQLSPGNRAGMSESPISLLDLGSGTRRTVPRSDVQCLCVSTLLLLLGRNYSTVMGWNWRYIDSLRRRPTTTAIVPASAGDKAHGSLHINSNLSPPRSTSATTGWAYLLHGLKLIDPVWPNHVSLQLPKTLPRLSSASSLLWATQRRSASSDWCPVLGW